MVMTGMSEIKMPMGAAIAGERVLATGHAGHVHLMDLATGRALWEVALFRLAGASACEGQAVSVQMADDIVVAGSMGHVFALRIDDGSVVWRAEVRGRGAGETSLCVGGAASDYVSRLES